MVALAIVVFLIAAVYSNLGLGGGLMYVPALILLAGFEKDLAVPASLFLVLCGTFAALVQHSKANNVDFRLAAYLSGGSCVGSIFGTMFNLSIGEDLFRYLFLAIVTGICCWMAYDLYKKMKPDKNDDSRMCTQYIAPAIGFAVFAGFLSGAFGIGGGAIMVPVLIYFLCRRVKLAVGTSAATIIPTTITGILLYVFFGEGIIGVGALEAFWNYVFILGPVAFVGAYLGTRAGISRLTAWQIKAAFLVLTVLVAATMIIAIMA